MLDGEFNCMQVDVRPDAAIRHHDLTLASGQGQLSRQRRKAVFAQSQSVSIALGTMPLSYLSGTSQGFDKVCAGGGA